MYEHKVIDHKMANTTRSLEEDIVEVEEEVSHRRSKRNIERKNYKKMNNGSNIIVSEGNTEMSIHMASEEHKEGDVEYSIISREKNWYKRGIKEAIAIRNLKPTLNKDEGRHYLSVIYGKLVGRGAMECPRNESLKITDNAPKVHTEEASSPL